MASPKATGWHGERGTSTERGYGSKWRKLRKMAMDRDDWLCQPCQRKGRVTPATQCDHVTPKHKGGTDDLHNLQGICQSCHKRKTQRESHGAQGFTEKRVIGPDGWPIE